MQLIHGDFHEFTDNRFETCEVTFEQRNSGVFTLASGILGM